MEGNNEAKKMVLMAQGGKLGVEYSKKTSPLSPFFPPQPLKRILRPQKSESEEDWCPKRQQMTQYFK